MIGALRTIGDRVLGRGESSITVPIFDGALKPNQLLEDAEIVAQVDAAEDLAADGDALLVASGDRVLRLVEAGLQEVARFDRPITALCALPDGGIAVALGGREIVVRPRTGGEARSAGPRNAPFRAANAIACLADGRLAVTDGSSSNDCAQWVHDLMGRGASGRLILLDAGKGEAREAARGLEYAFGACALGDEALVSESWRHRLVAVAADGRRRVVLARLPVYPSRLAVAGGGGFWLTAFAARTQLVEFVLRENAFRRRMMREIAPEHWIAPRLRSGQSYLEPMQGAHLRTMGVLKPWAPPRSYGLVIRVSAEGLPRYSLHSRVDGINHGIVAAAEAGGFLYLLAKGPGRLLRLPLATLEKDVAA
ncbi:hypothetical protein [Enhydrobacter sp.]|jgi:hypothetical protein|uniref:SMP-30/gluconolactonase/LRE family protein n=1 Tax=Enhydrobacter sp. TaxID=1894999 RepID=UPI00261C3DAA|nr:hypothetical protein [Enhydrobacter sp.]WIM11563.1 MAG: hypothetical protein OJF58_002522 [Enhydrobacter sp.]